MNISKNTRTLIFLALAVSLVFTGLISTSNFSYEAVKSFAQPQRIRLGEEIKGVRGKASWYGESETECRGCSSHRVTKCGVKYDETLYTLASNDFECGTEVWVVYGEKRVLAKINDTGGFGKYGRIADLSKATFASLADLDQGIIEIRIEPVLEVIY